MEDLQGRLANRVQLTSDGNMAYIDAVDAAFAGQIDYAMLLKVFGPGRGASARKRYMGTHVIHISGRPNPASNQHLIRGAQQRSNLTMRMNIRRFTRKTNGFSKKVENHTAAVNLHMLSYNFLRTHETLRVTPAMEAGIVDRFMDVKDLVRMLEEDYEERRPKTRGPYRRRTP